MNFRLMGNLRELFFDKLPDAEPIIEAAKERLEDMLNVMEENHIPDSIAKSFVKYGRLEVAIKEIEDANP